jgi:hypothetical protein
MRVGESAAVAKAFASDNLDRLRDTVSGGTDQISQAANQVNQAANSIGATLASGSDKLKERAAISGALIATGLSRLSGDALKPSVTLDQVQRDKVAVKEMVR